jgi:hypothetical protein
MDFLFGALFLEKERYSISWLSVGFGILLKLFYLSRLWCLGVAACLWLGDNIEILSMEK